MRTIAYLRTKVSQCANAAAKPPASSASRTWGAGTSLGDPARAERSQRYGVKPGGIRKPHEQAIGRRFEPLDVAGAAKRRKERRPPSPHRPGPLPAPSSVYRRRRSLPRQAPPGSRVRRCLRQAQAQPEGPAGWTNNAAGAESLELRTLPPSPRATLFAPASVPVRSWLSLFGENTSRLSGAVRSAIRTHSPF